MDFTATRIATDDFTPEQVKAILADARQQIEAENPIPNSKMPDCFFSVWKTKIFQLQIV